MGGAESFVDIALFGEKKIGLVRLGRSAIKRLRTITFLRPSTLSDSSAVS
jgi:hypothetical protein